MTLAEFRTEVRYWTERSGKPKIATHPTVGTGLEASLSESLRSLTAWTFCRKASASYSLIIGASTLDASSLSPRILHPLTVKVGGVELRDYRGVPGPVSPGDIFGAGIGSGVPTKWCWSGSGQIIQFDKAPSAGASAITLYGFAEHPAVALDADLIDLPLEWVDIAAAYAAARLVQPVAAGAGIERFDFMTAGLKSQAIRLVMEIQRQHPSVSIPMLRGLGEQQEAPQQ
jgi:hypothetical protein